MDPHITYLAPKEFAQKIGVSTSTLRRWEREGVIAPLRTPTGHRRYSLDMVESYLREKEAQKIQMIEHGRQCVIYTQNENSTGDISNENEEKSHSKLTGGSLIHIVVQKWHQIGLVMIGFSFILAMIAFTNWLRYSWKVGEASTNNIVTQRSNSPGLNLSEVLAATTSKKNTALVFNIPVEFRKNINARGITIDANEGKVYASNLLYGVQAGEGVVVSDGQTPIVSFNGVQSVNGNRGYIEFTGGEGISVNELEIVNDDKGSSQNIFKNINSNGTIVEATNNNDTLKLTAGSGINIGTTDKEITISANANSSYSHWKTEVNGVIYDNIENNESLEFVSGSDISISRSNSNQLTFGLQPTIDTISTINLPTGGTINGTDSTINFTNFDVNSGGGVTIASGQTYTVGSIGLNSTAITSGASLVGVNTSTLTNSNPLSGDLQTVLQALDSAMGSGSSKWTIGGGVLYPTNPTVNNFAVGGSVIGTAPLGVDVTNNIVYVNGDARVSSTMYAPNIGTGTDNSVLVLDSSGYFVTDEIDSRVWGSGLIDSSTGFIQNGNSFTALATLGTNDAYGLAFETNNTERMRIDAGGNVGIGTTSPSFKLELGGALSADRKIGINGTQVVYLPNQTSFAGSLILGNGGTNLSNTSGTKGRNNSIFGINAGIALTTGQGNVIFGTDAMPSALDADNNVSIGFNSLNDITWSSNNTAVGANAGRILTDGDQNTLLGSQAGYNLTAGADNILVGYQSGWELTTGFGNVVIGDTADGGAVASSNNVSLGFGTAYNATGGSNNTMLGSYAGSNIGGSNNILLGYKAGDALTSGANNIAIGYDVDLPSNTASNQLSIGNLIFGTGVDGTGKTLSTGNVGIGTTTPSQKFHVVGNVRISGALYDSSNSAGSSTNILTSTGTGTAWTSVSSAFDTTYFKQNGNSFTGLATLGTNDAYGLAFETNNTEYMRILTDGKVGIGTTSPTSLLTLGNMTNSNQLGIKTQFVASGMASDYVGYESNYTSSYYPNYERGFVNNFNVNTYTGANSYDLIGLQNNVTSSGQQGGFYGLYNSVANGGYNYGVYNTMTTGSYASNETTGVYSGLSTVNDGISQEITGEYMDLKTKDSTDVGYGLYVTSSGALTTGGTLYGSYYNLSDTDTTNYSIYVANGSGLSYFGSNVGIGTTAPSQELHVTGDIRVTGGYYDSSNSMGSDGYYLKSTGSGTAWTDMSTALLPSGTEGQMLYNNAGTWTAHSGTFWDDGNSRLGIGTTVPSSTLEVAGDIELANYLYFGNSTSEYLRWDGSDFIISDDLLPSTNDTVSLGATGSRWADAFIGPETLHIGSTLTDEGTISYDTTNNIFNFGTDSTTNGDIAFYTDDLYLDKSLGMIGIGTSQPSALLNISGLSNQLKITSSTKEGNIEVNGNGTLFLSTTATGFSDVSVNYESIPTANQIFSSLSFSALANNSGTVFAELYRPAIGSSNEDLKGMAIDTDNNILYVAYYDGYIVGGAPIYRCDLSTGCDSAGEWTTAYSNESYDYENLLFDNTNNTIYGTATDISSGVIRRCSTSTGCDNDGDWSTISINKQMQGIGIDDDNNIIYAGDSAGEVYRCDLSTGCDAVGEWTLVIDFSGSDAYSVLFDDSNNVLYISTNSDGIIHRCATSTGCDDAGDWTTSYDSTSTVYSLGIDTTNGIIYAGGGNGIIYRCNTSNSCDAQGDWTTSYDSPISTISTISYSSLSNKMYAGGSGAIVYECSTSSQCDAAGDWSQIYDGSDSNLDVSIVDIANSQLLVGTGNANGGTEGAVVQKIEGSPSTPSNFAQIQGKAVSVTYGSTSGALIFNTANTGSMATRMYINEAGNVGIGITSPTSIFHTVANGAKIADYVGNLLTNTATSSTASITKTGLSLESTGTWNGTGAINRGLYVNATGGTTNYSAIFEGGNVGIGTTAPSHKLDVVGDIALSNYLYFGNSTSEYLRWDTSNFLLSDDLLPNADDALDLGSDTARWRDLYLGGETLHIGASTTDEGTLSYTSSNILSFTTDSTTNGDIAFFTDDLYLDKSTGNAGIGTTSPSQRLEIHSDGTGNDAYAFTRFTNVNSSNGINLGIDTDSYAMLFESDGLGGLKFGVGGYETMRINTSRNVGIGTTSPTAKLHTIGANGDTAQNAPEALRIIGGKGGAESTPAAGDQGNGGGLYLAAGTGGDAADIGGTGGNISILAGDGGTGAVVRGNGGDISILAGSGEYAGKVTISGGAGDNAMYDWGTIDLDGHVSIGPYYNGALSTFTINGSQNWNPMKIYMPSTSATKGLIMANTDTSANSKSGLTFQLTHASISEIDAALVTVGKENLWTATNSTKNAFLAFHTASSGSLSEQLRITSGGYVGIGTTAPGNKLEVRTDSAGAIGPTVDLMNYARTAGTGSDIAFDFINSIDTARVTNAWIRGTHTGSGNQGNLSFITRTVGDATGTRLFIQHDGNVGIGTTSPGALLTVKNGIGATGMSGTNFIQGDPSASNTMVLAGQDSGHYTYLQWIYNATAANAEAELATYGASNRLNINASQLILQSVSGNVGIGTTAPTYKLDVKSAGTDIARFTGTNSTGCTLSDGGVIACSSDRNLKKNIVETNLGLDAVMNLRPVEFNWNSQAEGDSKYLGFIAQEVEQVAPNLVTIDSNGYRQLNSIGLIPVVAKAIQEQQGILEQTSASVQTTVDKQDEITRRQNAGEQTLTELAIKVNAWDNLFISIQSIIQTIQDTFVAIQTQLGLVQGDVAITKQDIASMSASLDKVTMDMANWRDGIASDSGVLGASNSATLDDSATVSALLVKDSLTVESKTTTFDLTVLNKLTTGVIELGAGIDGDEINSSTGIRFQTLAQGPVDFMNGKVVINVDGSVEMTHLKLNTTDPNTTTIGTATIESGSASMTIDSAFVTSKSMVFITPTSYVDKPIFVNGKIPGVGFVVTIAEPAKEDIEFQWMIVN